MTVDPEQVVQFLLEHGPSKMQTFWPEKLIRQYVNFHYLNGQLVVIYQKDLSIVGAGVARIINRRKLAHTKDTWRLAKEGNCVFFDNVVALHPRVIPRMWQQMLKMHGVRKFVAGLRHGKLRIWTFESYNKHINLLNRL